jgi:hypothetical protein
MHQYLNPPLEAHVWSANGISLFSHKDGSTMHIEAVERQSKYLALLAEFSVRTPSPRSTYWLLYKY